MMNEELYEKLESAFSQYKIEEEVEDVLLELAELLSDQGQTDKEITHKEKYGKTTIEVCGVCTPDEQEPEEVSVLIKWIKVGNQEFEINDYLL